MVSVLFDVGEPIRVRWTSVVEFERVCADECPLIKADEAECPRDRASERGSQFRWATSADVCAPQKEARAPGQQGTSFDKLICHGWCSVCIVG